MILSERCQHGDDGLPGVGAPGDSHVTSDIAHESVRAGDLLRDLLPIRRRVARDRPALEDAHVLCEPRRDDFGIHLRELPCCDISAGLSQYLEPHAETIRVELLVPARPRRTPEIQIEDTLQLFGCCQGDELAAVFEPALLNDTMDQLRLQLRDDAREVWRTQEPFEQALWLCLTASQIELFGHVGMNNHALEQ